MTRTIDTLSRAARHNMILRVECQCGNLRHFRTRDLAIHLGGGRDPRAVVFRCGSCGAEGRAVLLAFDIDRRPAIKVWRPHRTAGTEGGVEWLPEKLAN